MPAFYELSLEERIALTMRAMRERNTLMLRWQAQQTGRCDEWDARAAIAGALLGGHDAVADLGCWDMSLERHLAPGTRYIPVDVAARDERTIVCDFNTSAPPATGASAAACLGVFEYLHDVPGFLRALAAQYRTLVATYNCLKPGEPLGYRRSHAWVNDYTLAEIDGIFEPAGWSVSNVETVDANQTIWRLDR